jgi:hypothetical protein
MVLFGKTHLLVMISTGNLIEVDYERKTNVSFILDNKIDKILVSLG